MTSRSLLRQQRAALRHFYLSAVDSDYARALSALQSLREERSKRSDDIQEIMVMRELAERRPTYLLRRGAYDAPSDLVQPDTRRGVSSVSRRPAAQSPGTGALADRSAAPVDGRVAVNRFWQICFGRGLVRTPEDFGSQGEAPTHPELLDWLASDFTEHGWDVKRLVKMMVMSATYRQSSTTSAELRARDPENRLLARGPTYRWPAEMIRDNALAVSGLLVDKLGGPPVRPYEVNGLIQADEARRGRGPLPSKSVHVLETHRPGARDDDAWMRRNVTSVGAPRNAPSSPLQALVLLNDPQFVEASRVLANGCSRKYGDDAEDASLVDCFERSRADSPPNAEQRLLDPQLYDGSWPSHLRADSRSSRTVSCKSATRRGDESLSTATRWPRGGRREYVDELR